MTVESQQPWLRAFLQRHALNDSYVASANKWFDPLAAALAKKQAAAARPIFVALNGCQGSGKTTLADYLCNRLAEVHSLRAITLSLDDFYLTKAERGRLATEIHPLLITRGVPGTHDMPLLREKLDCLLDGDLEQAVALPGFDKLMDDRMAPDDWRACETPVDVVLLEGWCFGALPESDQTLLTPVNDLERREDASGAWRRYCNSRLESDFLPLYAIVDQWIMLCAPSFDAVFGWRREQEHKLAAGLPSSQTVAPMNDQALARFIQHYERITRCCLRELPRRVHHLLTLDVSRRIISYQQRDPAAVAR